MLKNNEVGKLTLCDFKTYSKATVIKAMCYWYTDRQVDKWNKIANQKQIQTI